MRAGQVLARACTDRLGGSRAEPPYDGANLGDHVGDGRRRRRGPTGSGLASRLGLPRGPAGLHAPGARRRRGPGRRPAGPARRPRPTRWSPPPPASRSPSWSPTACRCCWPTRTPASSAWRTPAGRAWPPASPAGGRGDARPRGARSIVARLGPSVCARCYEVPAEMRDEVAAVAPWPRPSTGTAPRRSTSRPGCSPSWLRLCRRRRVAARLHARGPDALLLPAGRRDRSVRRAWPCCVAGPTRGDRTEAEDGERPDRAGRGPGGGRAPDRRGRAGRRRESRTRSRLVVVTKTFPASDVRLLAGLGVRDVGENRDQEAAPKAEAVCATWTWPGTSSASCSRTRPAPSRRTPPSCTRSTGSPRCAPSGRRRAQAAPRQVGVLVQVSLDGDPARGGRPIPRPAGAGRRGRRDRPGLELRGVMAVAPLGADPAAAFARLAEVAGSASGRPTRRRPGSRPG